MHKKQTKRRPWWTLVLLDLVLIGLVLGSYTLLIRLPSRSTAAPVPVAVTTPAPTPAPTAVPGEQEPAVEQTPEPETPAWKFREHFTQEIVVTDTSYSSPTIAINITTHEAGEKGEDSQLTYYVADIYLADMSAFRTYLAKGEDHGRNTSDDPMKMVEESNALLAMTGDYESYNYGGTIIRNGLLYRNIDNGQDVCVLFQDGRMVCYDAGTLVLEQAQEQGILHSWTFGPTLVKNGALAENIYNRPHWNAKEPRAALGYYEPGHYCFVVADGRQWEYSNGVNLEDLGEILVELGCTDAYNMDGGGSAFMAFNGQRVNRQSSTRSLGDILLIAEPEVAK